MHGSCDCHNNAVWLPSVGTLGLEARLTDRLVSTLPALLAFLVGPVHVPFAINAIGAECLAGETHSETATNQQLPATCTRKARQSAAFDFCSSSTIFGGLNGNPLQMYGRPMAAPSNRKMKATSRPSPGPCFFQAQ